MGLKEAAFYVIQTAKRATEVMNSFREIILRKMF